MFPGQLVENGNGPLWAEEKNKAKLGGWEGEGQGGWQEPVFSQPGRRGGLLHPGLGGRCKYFLCWNQKYFSSL